MTEPSSASSVPRPRPGPIWVEWPKPLEGSNPKHPHRPSELGDPYPRTGGHSPGRIALTPDYQLSPPTPTFPPSPAGPPRGGERISNVTLASLHSLSDLSSPGPRRHSTPDALPPNDASGTSSPRVVVHTPRRVVAHWMWQAGPFEAARAIAPAPLLWGAYLIDRLQRAETMRWDLAIGAGVLISAGCLAHWQSLEMGLRAAGPSRLAPPGRGPNVVGKAVGTAAPLALLASAIATLRGQHLASRPIYTGGLLGTVFSFAIGHHVSAQLLERLPTWRPTHAPDGARGPALLTGLCVAALVGAAGVGARFDDWRWLLGFTLLSSTTMFLSLREWRGAMGQWPAALARPVSQSTTELLERSNSQSSGGDHYVAQPPRGRRPLAVPQVGQAF